MSQVKYKLVDLVFLLASFVALGFGVGCLAYTYQVPDPIAVEIDDSQPIRPSNDVYIDAEWWDGSISWTSTTSVSDPTISSVYGTEPANDEWLTIEPESAVGDGKTGGEE